MKSIRREFNTGNIMLETMLEKCKTTKEVEKLLKAFAPGLRTKKHLRLFAKRHKELGGKNGRR